jgi:hypothetical protein
LVYYDNKNRGFTRLGITKKKKRELTLRIDLGRFCHNQDFFYYFIFYFNKGTLLYNYIHYSCGKKQNKNIQITCVEAPVHQQLSIQSVARSMCLFLLRRLCCLVGGGCCLISSMSGNSIGVRRGRPKQTLRHLFWVIWSFLILLQLKAHL